MEKFTLFIDTRQTKFTNRFSLWNPKTKNTIYIENDGSELFSSLKDKFGKVELSKDEINYLFDIRIGTILK